MSRNPVPTSAMSTMATTHNARNSQQWAIDAEALLSAQGLWKYVSEAMRVPWAPIEATSDAFSATTRSARDLRDTNDNVPLESTDMSYLNQFYDFLRDWECWQMNNDIAGVQLTAL
jgi:hypothetical protein